MKNISLAVAVAAVLVAGASFYLSNSKLKEQELKLLQLEKKVNEIGGQAFINDANSVANQQLQNPPLDIPNTSISFDKLEHDFGTIKQGEKVKTKFIFTNMGSENLVIQNAFGSCGCTVPSYHKEPLAPGASAELEVEFDSGGKEDEQLKTVTVEANTEPRQTILNIKANIVK